MMKITYINHSGFLIETKDCYYIFDYYKGELPQLDKKKEVRGILHMLLTDNIINTLEQFQEMKNFQFLKVGDYMKTIHQYYLH